MKEKGSEGFSKEYWLENYGDPETMDGHGNAREHIRYLKAILDLHHVEIHSVLDLGFGLGAMMKEVCRQFSLKKLIGIEPSEYAFNQLKTHSFDRFSHLNAKFYQTDILSYLKTQKKGEKTFDLGICNSVLQYLSDDDIHECFNLLFKRVRYLYLCAPTDIELETQVSDIGFYDKYAIRRSKEKYLELISPYFTIVGSRLLESHYFISEKESSFNDLLYRF